MMPRPLHCHLHINVIQLNKLKGAQGSEDDFWNIHASPLKKYIFLKPCYCGVYEQMTEYHNYGR